MKVINGTNFELVEELDPVILEIMGYPHYKACIGCVARKNKTLCDKLGTKCLKKPNSVWKDVTEYE
jgi:hypothetical protein